MPPLNSCMQTAKYFYENIFHLVVHLGLWLQTFFHQISPQYKYKYKQVSLPSLPNNFHANNFSGCWIWLIIAMSLKQMNVPATRL